MPAEVVTGAAHVPRRARYLIPRSLPRRAEFLAACAVLLVLAHAVFAQLTLVVAVACYLTGRATRWRASWLLAPFAVALVWTLAVGPVAAVAGLTAGPARIVGYFGTFGHLLHPLAAYAGAGAGCPLQLPIALGTGAAEAAVAAWLGWLHTDEWEVRRPRPGLLAGFRRLAARRAIRYGAIVTRDGACLGVADGTGSRVKLTWAEAERGVLVCGAVQRQSLATSMQLVSAGLRRRKPAVVIDLTAEYGLPAAVAGACAAAGVQLREFGGPSYYEPFRRGEPGQRAALVMAMLAWEPADMPHRHGCAAYLADVFELLDAAPGDPRVPILDEVIHLLDPAALRARAGHVPAGYPRHAALTERVAASARLVAAEPAAVGLAGRQLRALRASPAGRWLGQPVGGPRTEIDLGQVVTGRTAALFSLGGTDDVARPMLARLVVRDLIRLAASLPAPADAVIWLAGFDGTGPAVGELLAAAPRAGLTVLLTTTQAGSTASFAEQPNALVVHRLTDLSAARRLAALAGPRLTAGGLELPASLAADDLLSLADGEFMLAVREPRRLVGRARAIRALQAGLPDR